MTDIRYEGYAITQDANNFIVNEIKVTGDDGKEENKGKEYLRPLKYSSTFKAAIKTMRDLSIKKEVKDLNNLEFALLRIDAFDERFMKFLEVKND